MSQKVALIAGVGPAPQHRARAFAGEGHAVAHLSRDADSSKPVAEQIRARGGTAIVVPTDVTDRESVNRTVARVHAVLGPVTVLAFNPSGYGRGSCLELDSCQISQPRRSFDYWLAAARLISPAYWRRFL